MRLLILLIICIGAVKSSFVPTGRTHRDSQQDSEVYNIVVGPNDDYSTETNSDELPIYDENDELDELPTTTATTEELTTTTEALSTTSAKPITIPQGNILTSLLSFLQSAQRPVQKPSFSIGVGEQPTTNPNIQQAVSAALTPDMLKLIQNTIRDTLLSSLASQKLQSNATKRDPVVRPNVVYNYDKNTGLTPEIVEVLETAARDGTLDRYLQLVTKRVTTNDKDKTNSAETESSSSSSSSSISLSSPASPSSPASYSLSSLSSSSASSSEAPLTTSTGTSMTNVPTSIINELKHEKNLIITDINAGLSNIIRMGLGDETDSTIGNENNLHMQPQYDPEGSKGSFGPDAFDENEDHSHFDQYNLDLSFRALMSVQKKILMMDPSADPLDGFDEFDGFMSQLDKFYSNKS